MRDRLRRRLVDDTYGTILANQNLIYINLLHFWELYSDT